MQEGARVAITGSNPATLEAARNDTRIENLPIRFAAIATEFNTGHEVWLTRGSLSLAIRASYALPGVFPPVSVGGRWLVDGALVNPVPVFDFTVILMDATPGSGLTPALGGAVSVASAVLTGTFAEV